MPARACSRSRGLYHQESTTTVPRAWEASVQTSSMAAPPSAAEETARGSSASATASLMASFENGVAPSARLSMLVRVVLPAPGRPFTNTKPSAMPEHLMSSRAGSSDQAGLQLMGRGRANRPRRGAPLYVLHRQAAVPDEVA